jgi:hypothetical protein
MRLIEFDDRLLDVSLEIFALEDYLKLLEKQIDHVRNSERLILDAVRNAQDLSQDDPDPVLQQAEWNYHDRVESLLPRFFRGPFLVALYAVYESAVTGIARLIQVQQGQKISLNDIRGDDFLDRAKKYYKHILRFELCEDNTSWQHVTMLSELRNAIAHTNGRLEMLSGRAKARIRDWEKKHIGIETDSGYIIVDSAFVQKTFGLVRGSLQGLIERYKQWDSARSSP